MLDSLITSKTRLKLLMKFFINSETTGYLRLLANEFGESTNGIRQELNRFEEAKLLESLTVHNKKYYRANPRHPYFADLHKLLLKYVGIDRLIDELVKRVGDLEQAYVINDFAQGLPGKVLDLVLVGNRFDRTYLNHLVRKTEANVSFTIRYQTVTAAELPYMINDATPALKIWDARPVPAKPAKPKAWPTELQS